MRTLARLALVSVVVFGSRVRDASASPPTVTNTGIEFLSWTSFPDHEPKWGIGLVEETVASLNADGDTDDTVLHVWDPVTGTATNLGLASEHVYYANPVFVGPQNAAKVFVAVDEAQEGADLNGDGDDADYVAHLVTLGPAVVVTNLELALTNGHLDTSGRLAMLGVREAEQSVDLNGDGDLADTVLHIVDPLTGLVVNVPQALDTSYPLWDSILWGDRGKVGYVVGESEEGNTDLNADGDAFDGVLMIFDLGSGATTNLGIAGEFVLQAAPRIPDVPVFVFATREVAQGVTDLNADGDAVDWVVHAVRTSSPHPVWNLGLAVPNPLSSLNVAICRDRAYFVVDETAQGLLDRSGDGDANDRVLAEAVFLGQTITNTTIAGFYVYSPDAANARVYGTVAEDSSGVDLNGDGDATDRVAALYESGTGLRLLGLAVIGTFLVLGDVAWVWVDEFAQGWTDLNADGDTTDFVLHAIDVSGVPVATNTLLAGAVVAAPIARNGNVLVTVYEPGAGGVDLNGDTDALDSVIHQVSPQGLSVSLGLAAFGITSAAGGRAYFGVTEQSEGAVDLNGNGNGTDTILFFVD